jgi:hypothetical protein
VSCNEASQLCQCPVGPQQQQLVHRQQQQAPRGARLVACAAPAAEKGELSVDSLLDLYARCQQQRQVRDHWQLQLVP